MRKLLTRQSSATRRHGPGPLARLDRRLRASVGQRRVHLHWANLFGVVSVACLLVLAVTGVLLMFTYVPSSELVAYDGPHEPLVGSRVSRAFDSTMEISLEQAGGMLVRQTHHWAALVLPAAMIAQILAVFLTGGFRRPRRAGWVLLILAFIAVLVAGWSGYALPDDMLSGTGLRIVEGVVLGIPVIGTWLVSWMFGGRFPGEIIENLYPVHVAIAPVLIAVLLLVRARLAYARGSAGPADPAARATLGLRLWPDAALRAAGLTAITGAVLVLLGATSSISPIGSYGPTAAGDVGAGSQPDWYIGFLDGALRLVPVGWEAEWFGWTWTFAILVPLAVVSVYFLLVVVYPHLESWVTGDDAEHDTLDRPRNVPARTGIGVAGALFYGVLWGAASADVVATAFSVSFESVITALQVALVAGPPLAFEVTRRICVGLQHRDREVARHGHPTGRIVRLATGGYVELHRPAAEPEPARLTVAPVRPRPTRPDGDGQPTRRERFRRVLARRFETGHVVIEAAGARARTTRRAPNRTD
ncbi:cytochrome b [Myceligenerans pegani]|uniref:Cytochrome bc1 complex cytochrome b subunit n=1 Tax=Myceligenerans pegani TaxID=2776917 RepID=A0ABR9MZ46_9MICO|nr:cytochrome b N-terminal domain-containing protein [Myceligenerans sp. TRM 65318]MBE1876281.1 cytochrome bc complex cytochrome b subunit [Myceligenerans sp. TRM 65318]MBE3018552.1 cytochrome bc complex cytochrome b subunit [Myceligenerans sp. TRM 65318]